jgi:NADH-quinone oxidoreductase subunit F
VLRPIDIELPLGTKFRILYEIAQPDGDLIGIFPGGTSMPFIGIRDFDGGLNEMLDMDFDFTTIRKKGSGLGTGAIIFITNKTNMLDILFNFIQFYKDESCGQCSPCREGSKWLYDMIADLQNNHYQKEELERKKNIIQELSNGIIGKTICAFGEGMAAPIKSILKYL